MDILNILQKEPALQAPPPSLPRPVAIGGMQGQSSVLAAAYLCKKWNHKGIFVAREEAGVSEILATFRALLGEKVYYLPERDFVFDRYAAISRERENQQAETLKKLRSGDYQMIVAPLSALLMPCPPPADNGKEGICLEVGATLDMEELTLFLAENGYTAFELVEGSGTFARRGGIVDIFSPNYPDPVRVEFFGDEIDRIVFFDVLSQRTVQTVQQVEIVACHNRKGEEKRLYPLLKNSTVAHPGIQRDLEHLEQGVSVATDRYIPLLYPTLSTALDLHQGLLFIEEYGRQQKVFSFMDWQLQEEIARLTEKGEYMADGAYFLDRAAFETRFNQNTYLFSALPEGLADLPLGDLRQMRVLEDHIPFYQEDTLCTELQAACDEGYTVYLLGNRPREQKTLLADRHIPLTDQPKAGAVCCVDSALNFNLRFPDGKVLLLCDGGKRAEPARRRGAPKGERIRSFNDLAVGDLVVHNTHGIGVYKGIRQVENQGVTKDYIIIGYDKGDTLYVPCPQLDLISKYIGSAEDKGVKLSRLGGSAWEKTKAKVKNQSREIARELIALYAKRMRAQGIPFDPDSDWQLRFEEQFPYEETDDQVRCVNEIKQDMELPYPMDRLLCGDVGFGKTEVALRAAFKAVDNGFQVAILCPTTILSEQHYLTVKERFADFPIEAKVLNRFRSPKETKQILTALEEGRLDIVIGTHRLLSKDVKFKKLGLLVIDEEQRFGVKHKEKIKELSVGVDVLTMSATPIPRTLNMALSGIRDLSIIEDPPADRQPVTTYVLEYDRDILLSAIARELKRGGCVFYLKNDIEALDRIAADLQARLPDARIAVGHGQMSGAQLEKTWEQVLNHQVDILICTTIIETGVDVSFANTLIIEDADRLGLSQLHQIRGRVGRSSTRAYAYLTYRQGSIVNEVAAKRLATIREFTEFGSGLKIAMRDLEIRGAGALLGEKQHGQMNIVGYDMYMRILKEAVFEEQGKEEPPEPDCAVDISVSAYIPKTYVPAEKMRIDLYKKIAAITNQEDFDDMTDELYDRFSDPPECILNLMKIALLRARAKAGGIQDIKQKQDAVLFFTPEATPQLLAGLTSALQGRVLYSLGARPYFTLRITNRNNPLEEINRFLEVYLQLKEKA